MGFIDQNLLSLILFVPTAALHCCCCLSLAAETAHPLDGADRSLIPLLLRWSPGPILNSLGQRSGTRASSSRSRLGWYPGDQRLPTMLALDGIALVMVLLTTC
jgi:hypothetical protein